MKTLSPLLLLLALFVYACGGDTKEMDMDQGGVEEEHGRDLIGDGNPGSENITLTDFPESTDFPNASIDDWTYRGATFNYEVSEYEFAKQTPDADDIMCANSAQGQHIHLIIDNEPYIAKYEPTFEQDMSDGQHYILTFLSRSYHESIKTPAAHRAVMANVMNGGFDQPTEITDPMLFYSRPKGNYVGKKETENVMLDFYPVNVELGDEYQVQATINGKEFMIDEWKPYFIEGLPMGENTVTLTLMRGDSIVDAPLNPVRRTFTLEALPAEEATGK
ncbi:phosphopeptide-binding protein [Neolewinella sp.]|uniref:phosphopeptide-binding protein n=1 Tax=Neolewinella sp. TaxID=2993543 RepID=UPI003B52D09F